MVWLIRYVIVGATVAISWCVYAGSGGGASLIVTPIQAVLLGLTWPLPLAIWLGEATRRGRPRIITSRQQKTFEGW